MRKLILLAALFAACALAQTVAINDTIYTATGAPWRGYVEITWPAFTTAAGGSVARGTRTVAVIDGTISVSLYPNDGATPTGIAYTATYRGSGTWSETWLLRASPSITTLQAVRTQSTLVTSVNGRTGAVVIAQSDIPGLTAALASAGSVSSVAGRTGAVVLTSADVGLPLVDNTADASKPVSAAQASAISAAQAASLPLHAKADTAGNADTVTNGVYTTGAGTVYLTPSGSAASLTSFPTLNQNTTGTAGNLSGTPALPDGTTATTQPATDASAKLATTAYTDAAVAAVRGTNQYVPDGITSGGSVAWISGLSFRVSTARYVIGGTSYSSVETALTLGAADATNPRIDVIAVNASGAAVVVAGTAAASPAKPAIDPTSQIELTFVYIAANATTPANVVVTDVYHENTEWTTTRSGTTCNLAGTTLPNAGTVDIDCTSATTGNYVQLAAAAPFDPAIRNNLVLYVRSKALWASTRNLQLSWWLSTTQKGSIVTLKDGTFGLNSAITSAYQQIIIPLSLFGASGLSVDRLRITVAGSGANIGYYLDDITLQGGVTAPTGAASIMRGLVFSFDGGGAAIAANKTLYQRVPFACTLDSWSIQSTTAETVTLKTWLISGGTAMPTVSNVISTSGVSLTTGTFVVSNLLTDFTTTAIPKDAQIAATLTAVTASQFVNYTLGCKQ